MSNIKKGKKKDLKKESIDEESPEKKRKKEKKKLKEESSDEESVKKDKNSNDENSNDQDSNDENNDQDSDLQLDKDINNESLANKYSNFLNRKDMVSYTEIKDIIGYKQKRTIEEMLSKKNSGFAKDTDYKFVKEKRDGVCKPINEIYMTVETLKCICLMSQTEQSQQFRKYYLQMEKVFRESASTESLNKLTNPILVFNDYVTDIKKYVGKEVVYLIELLNNEYKFGITADIIVRLSTHKTNFGHIAVVKIWDGINRSITLRVEDNIKLYTKYNKINIKKGTSTELFKTDNILKMIEIIDGYVGEATKDHYVQISDRKLSQQLELVNNVSKLIDKLGTDKETLSNAIKSWSNFNNSNNKNNAVHINNPL